MADTVRTEEELLVLFADNTNQAISAQDMRDFVVSAKVDDIVIADDLNNVAFSGDYNDLINTPSSTDYVVVLPSNSLRNLIVAANSGTTPLTVKGATSQTANLQEWIDSSGTSLVAVHAASSGQITLYGDDGKFAWSDSGAGNYIQRNASNGLINFVCQNYSGAGWKFDNSSGNVATVPLQIKGVSAQSGSLQEWINSSDAMLSKVDKNGVISVHADGSLDSLYTTTTAGVYLGFVTTSTPTVLLAPGGGTSGIIRLDSAFGDFRIIVGGTQVAGLKSSNAAFTTSTLTNTGHIQTGGILLSQRKSLSNYNSLQNEANLYLDGLNGGGWGGTATANGFGIWNAVRMTDDAGSDHLAHANEYYVTTAAAASWKTRVINKVGDITSLKEYLRAESNGTYALTSIGGAAVNATTSLLVSAPTATYTPLVVKGASSQSAKLQEWQNSSGTANASMEDNGNLNVKYLTVTEYVNVFNGAINVGYGSSGLSPTGVVNGRRLTMTPYSPSQITSDQDNYNPVSPWRNLRVSSDAARTITGLVAGQDGEERFFVNVGSFNIILAHESGSSTAENRFLCSTGSSITILPDNRVAIMYDDTTDRWRVFA